MNLTSLFASILSKKGHTTRKKVTRQLYKDRHDELVRCCGSKPIPWARKA